MAEIVRLKPSALHAEVMAGRLAAGDDPARAERVATMAERYLTLRGLDLGSEGRRIRDHWNRRVMWEARVEWGDDADHVFELGGDWGRKLEMAIRRRWQEGPGGEQHAGLRNVIQLGYHFGRDVTARACLLRRGPIEVGGDLAKAPGWTDIRTVSNLDRALAVQGEMSTWAGACWLRVGWVDGYEPTIQAVAPECIVAMPMPGNPDIVGAVIELHSDHIQAWDVRVPDWPLCRRYALRGLGRGGSTPSLPANLYDQSPSEAFDGPDYPIRWEGRPLLPGPVYAGFAVSDGLLPVSRALYEGTMELQLDDTWIEYVREHGAFHSVLALTASALSPASQGPAGPKWLRNFHGWASGDEVSIVPSSAEDVGRLMEQRRSKALTFARQVLGDVQLEDGDKPWSGVALSIRAQRLVQLWQEQERSWKPLDESLLRSYLALRSWLIRTGRLDAEDIGTPDLSVSYPQLQFTPEERERERKALIDDIRLGYRSLVDLWLWDHDEPDSPETRTQAMQILTGTIPERPLSVQEEIRRLGWAPGADGVVAYRGPAVAPAPAPIDDDAVADEGPDLRASPEMAAAAAEGLARVRAERLELPGWMLVLGRAVAAREALAPARARELAAMWPNLEENSIPWLLHGGAATGDWIVRILAEMDTDGDGIPDLEETPEEGEE